MYGDLKEERERRVGDFRYLLRKTNEHKFSLDGLRERRLLVIQDEISEIVS